MTHVSWILLLQGGVFMTLGPRTLIEFQEMFPDEDACWAYLRAARWPQGFKCPACQQRESSWLARRRLEQCRACRRQTSVTAGTVLHGTRVALRIWFLAFFFVGRHKKGISALQFKRDTGLGSYQTAWLLLHKVRSALQEGSGFLLTGHVEVDETYVGGREKGLRGGRQRGRKAIVTAAVESRGRCAGALRLSVVKDVGGEQLGGFVESVVDPSRATVCTDAWRGYAGLTQRGFRHSSETQGTGERAKELLPWVHTIFSNLKTWLRGTYHGVSKKHLNSYLQEFVYRFNRRSFEEVLFEYVIGAAAAASPLTYKQLTAEPTG
jgi:transposase-like protein